MRDRKTSNAFSTLRLEMHYERFEQIVRGVQKDIKATPLQIADFVQGGDDGWMDVGNDAQQKWLVTANIEEIISWVVDGLPGCICHREQCQDKYLDFNSSNEDITLS